MVVPNGSLSPITSRFVYCAKTPTVVYFSSFYEDGRVSLSEEFITSYGLIGANFLMFQKAPSHGPWQAGEGMFNTAVTQVTVSRSCPFCDARRIQCGCSHDNRVRAWLSEEGDGVSLRSIGEDFHSRLFMTVSTVTIGRIQRVFEASLVVRFSLSPIPPGLPLTQGLASIVASQDARHSEWYQPKPLEHQQDSSSSERFQPESLVPLREQMRIFFALGGQQNAEPSSHGSEQRPEDLCHPRENRPSSEANTLNSCDICHQTFPSSSNRNRHRRSVHLNHRVTCAECGEGFVSVSNVQRHQRIVHQSSRPFSCEVCDISVATRQSLQRHYRRRHPGFSPPPSPPSNRRRAQQP